MYTVKVAITTNSQCSIGTIKNGLPFLGSPFFICQLLCIRQDDQLFDCVAMMRSYILVMSFIFQRMDSVVTAMTVGT